MLKIFGGLLIVASCSALGFQIAGAYRLERQMLQQWISALDYMQCELQYRMTALPELCRQAASHGSGKVSTVLFLLADELDRQLQPDVRMCMDHALKKVPKLPESVRTAAEELGNTLGRFDTEGQLRQLEAARHSSRKRLEGLEKGAQERMRCYQTLGICGGAALAILLI